MSSSQRLTRSATLISFAILISRILGFVRDALIAGLFGTGAHAQAFVVAFRLPNLLRDLVAEGAASSALVPVFSAARARRSAREYAALVWSTAVLALLILCGVVLLGVLTAPWIVRLIAPGFLSDPAKLDLTMTLTRWVFPFLLLIGLTAYTSSLLHVQQRFGAPAFGQALFNLTMIAACLWLVPRTSPPVAALAVGVLAGGAAQLVLTLPGLVRLGLWRPQPVRWSYPEVRQIGRLLLPRLVGAGVYQLDLFIDTILASLAWVVGEGGVAALYFANRVLQLPLALFGIAMSTAALPTLSEQAADRRLEAFRGTVQFALRSVWAIMVPACVGLMVLAVPIVQVLFQRGAFDAVAVAMTASVVGFAAIGLIGYAGTKIVVAAFYALQDTTTPLRVAGGSLLVNVVCDLLLMGPLGIGGLALGTSISAIVNFLWLVRRLERRLGHPMDRSLWSALGRMAASGLVMGLLAWTAWETHAVWSGPDRGRGAAALAVVIIGSVGSYTVVSGWLRVPLWVELGLWRSKHT